MDIQNIERTAFGPGFDGHPNDVFRDELKGMDVFQWARAFKARVDDYLIRQIDFLSTGTPWTPFPLTVMTFVGIELLGSYKYGDRSNNGKRHFQKIVEDMDPDLAKERKPPKGPPVPLSDFIYFAFRHTYIHGFHGKWVFITHLENEAKTWVYGVNDSYVVVNIFWFYREFKRVYSEYFDALLKATNPEKDPLRSFEKTFRRHFSEWL